MTQTSPSTDERRLHALYIALCQSQLSTIKYTVEKVYVLINAEAKSVHILFQHILGNLFLSATKSANQSVQVRPCNFDCKSNLIDGFHL
jgi:hypothetical protein